MPDPMDNYRYILLIRMELDCHRGYNLKMVDSFFIYQRSAPCGVPILNIPHVQIPVNTLRQMTQEEFEIFAKSAQLELLFS